MMKIKTEKAIESIGKCIERINKHMETVQQEFPNANIYLEDSNNFNIMSDDTHDLDDPHEITPRHDRVLECFNLNYSSGGAW